jgi:hypothetical protein
MRARPGHGLYMLRPPGKDAASDIAPIARMTREVRTPIGFAI